MKQINLILSLLGVVLIILFFVLVGDKFADKKVLWLDGVVSVTAYMLLILVNGGMFVSSREFGGEVPALGVKMFFMWLYVGLAIPFLLLGYFCDIAFKWQLFVQLALMVVMLAGLLVGMGASRRLDEVERNSQSSQPSSF